METKADVEKFHRYTEPDPEMHEGGYGTPQNPIYATALLLNYMPTIWSFMLVYHVQVRVQTSTKTLTDLLSGPMSGSWPFPIRNAALCE